MIIERDMKRYKARRERLIHDVKKNYGVEQGVIVLSAGFEIERHSFRQESTFYYVTGIHEPAAVLCIYLDGNEILYLPNFGSEREKWVNVEVSIMSDPAIFGFSAIKYLSDPVKGYSYNPFFIQDYYAHLLPELQRVVNDKFFVFSTLAHHPGYLFHHQLFEGFQRAIRGLSEQKVDITDLLHALRRKKDEYERATIQRAVDMTVQAERAAASAIKPGIYEYQVQATIEHTFTYEGAQRTSFPTIVAAGKNSTVLHYTQKSAQLKDGDLVVVDIGAEYNHYAADLTRTYPANGKFTSRQKEVYELVLACQQFVAAAAKPGMFLRNPGAKDQSLHYLSQEFLREKGYDQYYAHGIGHYMGLDVHDVGSYDQPLEIGDVFTIEPGIYIPHEALGVRIEDDFVMMQNGAHCLSAALPKTVEEIEHLMKS